MTTIHELRLDLEAAQAKYVAADIEHPTAVLIAKDLLTNARFDYWAACADLVTRLPSSIIANNSAYGCTAELIGICEEITGEQL
jgi:hypothetical protein